MLPLIPKFDTSNEELKNDEDYKVVSTMLLDLWNVGIIQRGGGYCVGMSDMFQRLLATRGIEAELKECKLTVIGIDPPGLMMVGHTGFGKRAADPLDVDSHVVCITKTKIPMLIDCSVFNIRPEIPWICEPLADNKESILELDFGTSKWLYQEKEESRLPKEHQLSIVGRIKKDQKIDKSISFLKWLVILALGISSLNAVRGGIDFYNVYINDQNKWGPNQMERMSNRLKNLEEDIQHLKEK